MEETISALQQIYQENKEQQILTERQLLELREELDEKKQEIFRKKRGERDHQQYFSPFAAAASEEAKSLEEEQESLLYKIRQAEEARDRYINQNERLTKIVKEMRTIWDKETWMNKITEAKSLIWKDPEKADYLLDQILRYLQELK